MTNARTPTGARQATTELRPDASGFGARPGFAASYSFGNMILMKPIVFSVSFQPVPYQAATFYIGARPHWPRNLACVWMFAPALPTRRTGKPGIDSRFANVSPGVSPRKHLLAGRLSGLPSIVGRPHWNSSTRRRNFAISAPSDDSLRWSTAISGCDSVSSDEPRNRLANESFQLSRLARLTTMIRG